MSSARSRAGAPGEMIEWYKLPANDEAHDVMFLFLNGVPSFVDFSNEDKSLKPEGTKGWFRELVLAVSPHDHKLTSRQSLMVRSSCLRQMPEYALSHRHQTVCRQVSIAPICHRLILSQRFHATFTSGIVILSTSKTILARFTSRLLE